MRLRRKPGVLEKLESFDGLVLSNPHHYRGKWDRVFCSNKPIHLELGTGKGGFISSISQLNPEVNYVGIERVPGIIYQAAVKIAGESRSNVRLIVADAGHLPEIFARGEISRIYLNFSDPWPKKRHAKRRLTHPFFLQIYRELLPPGGEIHLKTDNQNFFEYSLDSIAESGLSLGRICYDLHHSCITDNVMTEYEKRFSDLGQPIYRLEAYTPSLTP